MDDLVQAGWDKSATVPQPVPARRSLRGVPWRWGDVWIGLATLVAMLAYSALTGRGTMRRWWLVMTLIILGWMFAYPLLVARSRIGLPPWPRPRAFLVEGIIAVAVTSVILVAMTAFTQLVARSAGETSMPESPLGPLAYSSDRSRLAILTVLVIVVGPIAEEIFFRGMLYNALRQRTHPLVAAILQAVAFGLFHPFPAVYRAVIAVVGFLLAMIYEWRQTLLTPILVHALVNAASVATIFLLAAAFERAPALGVVGERVEGGCQITSVMAGGGRGGWPPRRRRDRGRRREFGRGPARYQVDHALAQAGRPHPGLVPTRRSHLQDRGEIEGQNQVGRCHSTPARPPCPATTPSTRVAASSIRCMRSIISVSSASYSSGSRRVISSLAQASARSSMMLLGMGQPRAPPPSQQPTASRLPPKQRSRLARLGRLRTPWPPIRRWLRSPSRRG